jgi:predicted RNase H-like nuclease (RuvC/YqgF family)
MNPYDIDTTVIMDGAGREVYQYPITTTTNSSSTLSAPSSNKLEESMKRTAEAVEQLNNAIDKMERLTTATSDLEQQKKQAELERDDAREANENLKQQLRDRDEEIEQLKESARRNEEVSKYSPGGVQYYSSPMYFTSKVGPQSIPANYTYSEKG